MSKSRNRRRQQAPTPPPAPVFTANDGTIIGRMDDLQKAFTNMQATYDLSQRGASFIQAAMIGLRSQSQAGANFGPGEPNLPQQPEEQPRQFAYTPGTNLTWMPRAGYGILDFNTLRGLSFASKEIRLNFELVKRTLRGLGHEITQIDKTVESFGSTYKANPPDYDDVKEFWKYPDGFHNFDDWVDLILEDALAVGASAIYKNPDATIEKSAQPIDAITWRILTDLSGRVPKHPMPAFIQTTYGRASFWCSRKHLTYSPLHPTVNNPYGYAATEFIIQSIVQGIKHDSGRTGAFTEGNVPAAFVGLPTSWSPSQIQDFTTWFNGLIEGDVSRKNKIMFIPHDGQGIPVSPFSSINENQTELDEWLLKIAAWTVGNNPAEFGLTQGSGLGGKGALDAGENAQFRGSTAVYTQYISRIVEDISHDYLGAPWVKSTWQGLKPPEDDEKDAAVETSRINSGVWSVEFVQDKLGYDRKKYGKPTPNAPAKVPPKVPPQGPVGTGAVSGDNPTQTSDQPQNGAGGQAEWQPTRPAVKLPPQFAKIAARAAEADILAWRDKSRFALQKGLAQPEFKSDCIPPNLKETIEVRLEKCSDRSGIDSVFAEALRLVRMPEFNKGHPWPPDDIQETAEAEVAPEVLEKRESRQILINSTLDALEALELLTSTDK
jgi:hypothetical protein